MDQETILLTILGMALVTYLPRVLPTLVLSSRALPPLAVAWLRYVPVAVLSAIVFPLLMIQEGRVSPGPSNFFLWAAIPTALVGWRTKSLFGAVAVGVAVVAAARYVFGL